MRIRQTIYRPAFTLMELLVATALILFIMAIIAQMFGSGTKTFSNLRTAAQLQTNARAGINVLRSDLGKMHFDGPQPYVADQRLDRVSYRPPLMGYFEFRQGQKALFEPGLTFTPATADGEGLFSTRADQLNCNHTLKFTMVQADNTLPTELYCARVHPLLNNKQLNPFFITAQTPLYSRWAEVHYFLIDQGTQTSTGLHLHTLRRRIRIMPAVRVDYPPMPIAQAQQIILECNTTYYDVIPPYISASDGVSAILSMPGPAEINEPAVDYLGNKAVFRLNESAITAHPTGDDILVTDVLSFEVKAAWFRNPVFNNETLIAGVTGSSPRPYLMVEANPADTNTDEPFSDLRPSVFNGYTLPAPGMRIFDTGYQNAALAINWDDPNPLLATSFMNNTAPGRPPTRINIRALQIKIRVWDTKAEQARQVTVVNEV